MSHFPARRRARRGATLVLIALLMVAIVGMVAFSIEVGRMYLVRSQLQSAVDAGALAASLRLSQDPDDVDAAKAAAEDFVQLNRVGWLVTVPDDAIAIEAGTWDADAKAFVADPASPNAVRVFARQSGEPLMFAQVFGHSSFSVPQSAIASGSGSIADIMMVLDLSSSMKSQGRIEALQSAAPEFVNIIRGASTDNHIGVMGYGAVRGSYDPAKRGDSGKLYSSSPDSLFPSGDDYVAVVEGDVSGDFDGLNSNVLTGDNLTAGKYNGWTPTGAAIRDAAHYLTSNSNTRPDVRKVMVLMSDGHANKPNGDGPGYALKMAKYASQNDIQIHTISLGNSADTDLMKAIANETGGTHFDAGGSGKGDLTDSLTRAFRGAALSISRTVLVQ